MWCRRGHKSFNLNLCVAKNLTVWRSLFRQLRLHTRSFCPGWMPTTKLKKWLIRWGRGSIYQDQWRNLNSDCQGFQNSLDFSQTTTNNDLELQSETDSFEEDLARIDDIDAFLKPQETSPVKQCNSNGFATASGRQISVSESALEAARSKFDSDSLLQTDTCGFATASGSKISISSQSLEKAQSLWRHMGDQEPLIGLSAASCKKIPISESALSKGNQIYNEVLEERPLLLKQKPIPISQKALAQGRRLMGPILADTEPGKQESSTLDGDTKSSLLKPRQLTRKSG